MNKAHSTHADILCATDTPQRNGLVVVVATENEFIMTV